jgi:hypothetical protein
MQQAIQVDVISWPMALYFSCSRRKSFFYFGRDAHTGKDREGYFEFSISELKAPIRKF